MGTIYLPSVGVDLNLDVAFADPADVLSSKFILTANGEIVSGTMPNNGTWATTIECNSTVAIPKGYHSGSGTVKNVTPTMAGGTYSSKTTVQTIACKDKLMTSDIVINATPTMAGGTYNAKSTKQTISCKNKLMTSDIVINAITGLDPSNIKKGVTIGGVTGTWEGYVSTSAADLYYYGDNKQNITPATVWYSGSKYHITFYDTFIEVELNSYYALYLGQINFTAYSYLNVSYYISSYNPSGNSLHFRFGLWDLEEADSCSTSNIHTIITKITNYNLGTSGTARLSLANLKFTSNWGLDIVPNYSGTVIQISRIWLS